MEREELGLDAARIRRLITALSCASFERFDHEAALIVPDERDELGMLEGALQLFIDELTMARLSAERAIRESEQARTALEDQLRTVKEQQATINELSAPVMDLWPRVVTIPIIGSIDSRRAEYISERLLSRVVERRAAFVLIDLTGAGLIDTHSASHLVRLAQSIRLLGAKCVFTGIGAEVAPTLAALSVDWGSIPTLRSLQDGLRYALSHLNPASVSRKEKP